MALTLINPFIIPPKVSDDDFVKQWREVTDRMSRAPGFIETHLHRNTYDADPTFRFINIARWESATAYLAAFGGQYPQPQPGSDITFFSGLYESLIDVSATDSK